jgi:hypothetical protein
VTDKLRPEVGGHASTDATIHDLPPLPEALTQPADPDAPRWCPCGHWTGGVCDDTFGVCRADGCACQEEDDE